MDIDQSFLDYWGGGATGAAQALATARDWLAEVEAVYAMQLPLLDVVAIGFHVHRGLIPQLSASATANNLLTFYQKWLSHNNASMLSGI